MRAVWLILMTVTLAARGDDARLVIPRDFVWIEFTAWQDKGDQGGNSTIFARSGARVRLESIADHKKAAKWYEGLVELDPSNPKLREKKAPSPLLFDHFARVLELAPVPREVILRAAPAGLFLARDGAGYSQALWTDRKTGYPLRFVITVGTGFSWTEIFPVGSTVPGQLLEPSGEGAGLREIYSEEIKKAKEQFDIVLRDRTWKKDIEGTK